MIFIRLPLILVFVALLAACSDNQKATENKQATVQKELTPEEKFAKLQKEAEAGGAEAQYKLGVMYEKGEGVSKNAAKAFEWFQKAAIQGHAAGQFSIGEMYFWGNGVPKDTAKGVEWYQKSAAQGNAEAQQSLGFVYQAGRWLSDVPRDVTKALEWYQKAAAQGNAAGQFSLGMMYEEGDGVSMDAAKAVEWYQKAAAQGNTSAQRSLGNMYKEGNGVPKDSAKAFEWFQKAAAQGNSEAQKSLGKMYWTGEGVSKNVTLAYAWQNLATVEDEKVPAPAPPAAPAPVGSASVSSAREIRNAMERRLTPAQRAEGQRLASNWKIGDTLQASSDDAANPISPDGKPVKRSTGTGFAVSHNGHALTNHHVIEGCAEVRISGREGIAKVITSDSVNDLALLQLPGKSNDVANLNPDLGKLRQGEDIVVYGYPLNSLLSSGGNLTPGIISALTGLDNNTNQIQITAPIQGGSSGSPVMDKKGNIVGLVSGKLDIKAVRLTGGIPQNVNFAVNGQTVKAFLDANKVAYKTGGGFFSREKSNSDIAEDARKWTMVLECWK